MRLEHEAAEELKQQLKAIVGRHVDYAGTQILDSDHLGADIALPEGTAITAGVNGTIRYYGPANGYGTLVVVIEAELPQTQSFLNAYDQTVQTSTVLWILGHLRATSERGGGQVLRWRAGERVSMNDVVGFVQHDSLNGAGGEHLHLGLRLQSYVDAIAVDPRYWFRGYEVDTTMGRYYANPIPLITS